MATTAITVQHAKADSLKVIADALSPESLEIIAKKIKGKTTAEIKDLEGKLKTFQYML
jgi:hypothetical protein